MQSTRELEAVTGGARAPSPSQQRFAKWQFRTPDIILKRSSAGGHHRATSPSSPSVDLGITSILWLNRNTDRREVMDERIPHLQDRQFMDHADLLG